MSRSMFRQPFQTITPPNVLAAAEPDTLSSSLIEQIYAAALNPSRWPEVVAACAEWLRGSRALLFTPSLGPGDGGFFYSHGITMDEMNTWSSRHVGKDFWTVKTLERGLAFEGSVLTDEDLSTRQELLASDYYRHHLARMNIRWMLGCVVLAPPHGQLPLVACTIYRGPEDEGFDQSSRRKMALLLPHYSRALSVMFRLRDADSRASAGAAALDALSFGVVLLDSSGRVVQSNMEANRILTSKNGLTTHNSYLKAADAVSQGAWENALRAGAGKIRAALAAHSSKVVRVPKLEGTEAYVMQLTHLPELNHFGPLHGSARMIVFITDERRSTVQHIDVLVLLYHLTPAEARCALALGDGKLALAADRLGLSLQTVKTQLKQIYAKTGCRSRAELTRLMLSLAHV